MPWDNWESWQYWLAGSGLGIGLLFGVAAQRSRFCMVSALSNLRLMADYRQVHAYLAALAVAVAGGFLLEWFDLVAISDSSYRRGSVNWLGATAGGVCFGVGAILAGGCASRTLVRSAEGNLGAIISLLGFALVGMMAQFGILNSLLGWSIDLSIPLTGGDAGLSMVLGLPAWLPPLLVVGLCLFVILRFGRCSDHPAVTATGAFIGLLVLGGWWITGKLGVDPFDPLPPSSLTIAGPLARNAFWLTSSNAIGSHFALWLVPGVMLGAWLSALISREFHWVPPAGERMGSCLLGGAMMGLGAMLAGGCNVGQGLTGLATLSITSVIAATSILAGMSLMLWRMERE